MPLILNRFENERVIIGDDIAIQLLSAVNGRATLSIDAPKDICVDRAEIRTLRNLGLIGKGAKQRPSD